MNNQDLYFKNEAAKYMVAVIEVEGKILMNLLVVYYYLYSNENLAKKWYEYIKQTIKNSEYTDLAEAMEILEVLYRGMIGKI